MAVFVPDTGNQQLNLVLEELANNVVTGAAANTGNAIYLAPDGSIRAPGGNVVGYLNQYMWVTFTDDVYGTNASASPMNRSYYGLFNSADGANLPNNFLNYSYTATAGFGSTMNLYYRTTGARSIDWDVNTAPMGNSWLQVNPGAEYVAIDLDVITEEGPAGPNGISTYTAIVYQANANIPETPSGGSYNFSTNTLITPTDWQANLPAGNTMNVWGTTYTFSTDDAMATITANTWVEPNIVYKVGVDGNTSIVATVFQANSTTPGTITTQGYYDFGNNVLTAPEGWFAYIPPSMNTNVWSSQATFITANSQAANVSNTTAWSNPVVTFTSGGVGSRGIVPLAYILCNTDPRTFTTDSEYTAQFSAARTNIVPPIGVGFLPIDGDTAQFFFANASNTANNGSVFRTYLANNPVDTKWAAVTGQVIDGNLLVSGTITANKVSTNDVYALQMRGGTVTSVTDASNVGFFLNGNTVGANAGDALFTGNVRIGKNLTVDGLITAGSVGSNASLMANTVIATTITPNAVTGTAAVAGVTTYTKTGVTANNFYYLNTDPNGITSANFRFDIKPNDAFTFSGSVTGFVQFSSVPDPGNTVVTLSMRPWAIDDEAAGNVANGFGIVNWVEVEVVGYLGPDGTPAMTDVGLPFNFDTPAISAINTSSDTLSNVQFTWAGQVIVQYTRPGVTATLSNVEIDYRHITVQRFTR